MKTERTYSVPLIKSVMLRPEIFATVAEDEVSAWTERLWTHLLKAVGKHRLPVSIEIRDSLVRSRAGKVDTEMLKDLGMTAEQFAGFVKRYTDRFDKIRKKTDDKPPLPKDIVRNAFDQMGSKKVQEGRSTDKRLGDTSGMSDLTPDQIRKLYESRKAKISPEYRKHVEAYLRAISENAPTEDE